MKSQIARSFCTKTRSTTLVVRRIRNGQTSGQGLLEYGLLLILIAAIALLGLSLYGFNLKDTYESIIQALNLNPQQTESCKKVYQNEFKEPLSGWDEIRGKFFRTDGVTVSDGKLILEALNGTIYKTVEESDYTLNFKGIITQDVKKSHNGFGVVFRTTQNKKGMNGYMFEFEKVKQKDTGIMYFSKYINGVQVPFSKVAVPAGFDFKNPGDISLDVRGDTFAVYRNGQPIAKLEDKTYTTGTGGLATNQGTRLFLDTFELDSSPQDCEK